MDYDNTSSSSESDATTVISSLNMDCSSSDDACSVTTEENLINDLQSGDEGDSDSDSEIERWDIPVSEATILDGLIDGSDYHYMYLWNY